MLRDDILIRQIRQMAAAIFRLAGLQEEKKDQEVLDESDDFLAKMLGLKTQLAEQMSPDTLRMALQMNGKFDLDRSLLCGALLATRWVSHLRQGKIDKANRVKDLVKMLHNECDTELIRLASFSQSNDDNTEKNAHQKDRETLFLQLKHAI